MSKVLEKIIFKRLYFFLEKYEILYNSQYGFRESRSTISAITEFLGNLLKNYDDKNYTIAIFLDLSKAFDTVDHNILLNKLDKCGIRGNSLEWFSSYLSNRKQYVKCHTANSEVVYSEQMTVNTGVPQGSVLGPLLFIIYINDLPLCLDKCKSGIFADDTTIYYSNKNLSDVYSAIKSDLEILMDWFKANKLSCNLNKTSYMLFKPKNSNATVCDLKLGDDLIKQVKSTNFLGVYLDDELNWKEYLNHIYNKINKNLYLLAKIKNLLPVHAKKSFYFAHIYSHLNYGTMLWGPMAGKGQMNKIFKLQKRCVRLINNSKFNAHTDPIFKEMKLLKLEQIIELDILKFSYKHSRNLLPNSLTNMLNRYQYTHQYNTRNRQIGQISHHSTAMFNKSFLCKINTLWVPLPSHLKNVSSLHTFSKGFANLIFNKP